MHGLLNDLRELTPPEPIGDPSWAIQWLVGDLPEEQRSHAAGFLVETVVALTGGGPTTPAVDARLPMAYRNKAGRA